MKIQHKAHVKWVVLLLSILALTIFLVACGTGGTGSAITTPTPTPTPTPHQLPAPLRRACSIKGLVFRSTTQPAGKL